MGITALGGASLLIYGLFAGDSEIAKINSYIESTRISASIGSAVVFAITAFEYFSIYKPMVERIENYESILGQNSFLRQD
jgi:hypothetical protein